MPRVKPGHHREKKRPNADTKTFRALLLEPQPLVPFGDAFLGIALELLVAFAEAGLDPRRLELQHQMRALRRLRQLGVDRRREGMDQLRPARIPKPQGAAALAAEIPLPAALPGAFVLGIAHLRAIDADVAP